MGQKLNCWPGCYAMVRRSTVGNEGKIIKCISVVAHGDKVVCADGGVLEIPSDWFADGVLWHVDGAYSHATTDTGLCIGVAVFYDDNLRPLRDDDGVDEMLARTGLPNKETME